MDRGKPLVRRTPMARGGPLNKVSATRRRVNASRSRLVSAMRLAARGRCARCGSTGLPVHGHERLARAQGGDILNPDCLLCPICNVWCEDNPQIAAWTGWKISGKWPHSPALDMGQAFDTRGNTVDFNVDGAA